MDPVWNIVALSVVEIYGDFFLKFYAQSGKLSDLAHGLVGYAGVVFFLIRSLRTNGTVLYVNGMWDGISGLVESIAAFVLLGERLKGWTNYLGLALTIVGIVLLKQ